MKDKFPVVKLNNGVVVLAKADGTAWKGANVAQAEKKAAEVGGFVVGRRPFFVTWEGA